MAEMVVSTLLSSFLQVAFERLASRQVVEYFRGRKKNEELCEKLKMMLLSMDPLVAYAELKQTADALVRVWLDAVREVVLDAEDLLEEIDIQVTQTKLETESQTINSRVCNFFKVSSFSSFNHGVESSMNEILGKLELLQSQRDQLGLKSDSGTGVAQVVQKVESTSHLADSDNVIYGRDDDKETIFDWLTSSTEHDNKVSIISIVGMGGLGKTTLAKHVCNDPRVQAKFDVQAWVCVSDDFDVFKLTKAILGAITNSAHDNMPQQLELVHRRLKEELLGKKFLLVLDDVWNNRRDQWEAVQTPLNYGAGGSKILVTTRSREVADSCVRSVKIHELQELEEDYSWKVFVKHAFNGENHKLKSEFEEIGRQIVKKCKGLPLALKTIGSLLYRKLSVSEWESVLKSEIWQLPDQHNNIIPALLLSYHHLPSHLKRCFAFCALFPKDFNIDREELILLWMGENYLQCYSQNKSMEEVGKDYFHELLSRSFFQQSREDGKYYVMHDLLNDLAKYVCGNVCFTLEVGQAQSIPEKTRHFSFLTNCLPNFEGSKDLFKARRVRTFLPLDRRGWMVYDKYVWSSGSPICDLLCTCRFLRVLSLCNNRELRKVPDSVGNLKHLHSLDLSGTSIQKLPRSTCSLFNLNILKLQHCRSLIELPKDMNKLRKLHHLDLRGTKLRKLHMHLGKLKNLQVLMDSFCVGKGGEFKIQQLGELNLRGELDISEMENIGNPSDASTANLESKMHLVKLKLEWSWEHDVSEQEKEVLENLRPSNHLEELRILCYGGREFPSWFGDDSLSSVVFLKLRNCGNCMYLPSLGQLPSLKKLLIIGLWSMVAIGEEFYGSTSSSFASLETLIFKEMNAWKKWECKVMKGAFPKLKQLSIKNCPKLEEPLPEQLPCLEKLTIDKCKELGKIGYSIGDRMKVSSVDYYLPNPIQNGHNSLVDLSIGGCCESLTVFPLDFFPNLCSLYLHQCDNLKMISQDQPHNHLGDLSIDNCCQFESFPKEGLFAPRLERFSISGLKNLKSLPKQMDTRLPSLSVLRISCCSEVESTSNECLPSSLKKVSLSKCSEVMASLKRALGTNTSIERMDIYGMDMECFPYEGFLPSSLTQLHIIGCGDLKRLYYRGLCHASSLTHLWLSYCGSIRCLPEEGLPKSISSLTIYHCPLLKQRCQKPNGQDWGKIAHIQHLHIE